MFETPKNNAGFTLVEVMLVSAVVAILVALMAGNVTVFVDNQKVKEESAAQAEIKRSVSAFAATNLLLPEDDFGSELSAYGNFSPRNIVWDAWNRQRHFKTFSEEVPFRYDDIDVYYGIFYSAGADGCVGETTVCLSAGIPMAVSVSAQIDKLIMAADGDDTNLTSRDYDLFEPEGDDMIFKYSDLKDKKDMYKVTAERIGRIVEALQLYSRTKYYEAISEGEANTDKKIFVPPANLDAARNPSALYGDKVLLEADAALPAGVTSFSNDPADEAARRASMIALMNMLALPESYCCNASKRVDIAGAGVSATWVDSAFFYYSYPAPLEGYDGGGNKICTAYPAATADKLDGRKMPAKITVEEDACGN